MKAIRINQTGDPDVMHLEEIERPVPKHGQVLIKIAAAGINYADLAQRQGHYLTPTRLPMTMGFEAAGMVEQLGPDVTSPAVGTRVAAFVTGAYAEYAVGAAATAVPIPDTLDFNRAAALLVQGVTAYQLLHDSAQLQPGESVLVHAAAGGVGTLAVQLARLLGAGTVIGTASSDKKLDLARRLGANLGINYTDDSWPRQVREATGGLGADVILEMVGGENIERNLQCLAPFGRMVVFGAASGQPSTMAPTRLMAKNQTITGYWLTAWMSRPARVAYAIQQLLGYIAQRQLEVIVGETFPLARAADAHRAIAARRTIGKVVLLV